MSAFVFSNTEILLKATKIRILKSYVLLLVKKLQV